LEYAKSFGYLFVGLDSDMRVKELKGDDRPFNSLDARFKIMSSLKYVDEVTSFDSDVELKSILAYYQPDIMIIGDDYKGKEIIGREYVKEVVFFAKTPNISTTKILNNKKN
jgi:D-beta-D-heptose 7-phosphate kinase/D-beta-D-heptose 1-phosphate adenosyltransferase